MSCIIVITNSNGTSGFSLEKPIGFSLLLKFSLLQLIPLSSFSRLRL